MDGTRCSVLAVNQLANTLRRAQRDGHPFPPSMRQMDMTAAVALQGWFYAHRWGRLPPTHARRRRGPVFRFARTALLARCNPDPWWSLDELHPRCDPRIPITDPSPRRRRRAGRRRLLAYTAANKVHAPTPLRATPRDLVRDAHAAAWLMVQIQRAPRPRPSSPAAPGP